MGRLRGTQQKGGRVLFPYDMWIPTVSSVMTYGSAQVLDASGEYVDWQFQAMRTDKAIASFMARFGTIGTGDAATPFDLMDVDVSAQPSRPGSTTRASGTFDTTAGGIANTSRLFTFGSAYTPASANENLAARIGWAGAQNLQILPTTDKGANAFPFVHTFLGGAHGVRTNLAIFGIKFSDGTWMPLPWCYPVSAIGSTAFGSGSGSNEYGMKIILPFSMMVDRIAIFHDADAVDQFELHIRNSARVSLASVAVEGDFSASVTWGPKMYQLSAPVHMRAGKAYYVTKVATAAGTVDIQYMDAYEAAAMDAFLGNANCLHVNRTTTSDPAFTETTTRKVLIGVEGYALAA